MKTNEKIKLFLYIIIILFFIIYGAIFFDMYFVKNKSYAKETSDVIQNDVKISEANEVNINQIIEENTNDGQVEQITKEEKILEYLTQYKVNKNIPKGISYVVQEGRNGKQEITIKTTYDKNGNIINSEQVSATVTKAAFNKIVEIGGANYTSSYKVKNGDKIYVTSDELALRLEPDEESKKMITLKKDEEVKVLEIQNDWYKVLYNNRNGWIKKECTVYINPKSNYNQIMDNGTSKTKQELLNKLSFNMKLNEPSGFSLEQFKSVLSDNKDLNKVFETNAEYFYYIEKQYNINGIFVASVGIHESAWGTSKISLQKNNLFGYGAYDSSPYNGAYSFNSYSESIDLIARVFVKYYLNPYNTSIYGGEKALGTYYNGPNLTGINNRYASDKNWANAVYSYMKYLYNKL